MKHRLFTFVSAVSLILLVGTFALGARAKKADDHFIFTIGGRFFHLASWSRLIAIETSSPWPGHEPFLWITKPSRNETPIGPILFHHLVDPHPHFFKNWGVVGGAAFERTYIGPDHEPRWDRTGNNKYSAYEDKESRETQLMRSYWTFIPRTHFLIIFVILPVAWCTGQILKRMKKSQPTPTCKACGKATEPAAKQCPHCGHPIAAP